jgi:hypothetical protein
LGHLSVCLEGEARKAKRRDAQRDSRTDPRYEARSEPCIGTRPRPTPSPPRSKAPLPTTPVYPPGGLDARFSTVLRGDCECVVAAGRISGLVGASLVGPASFLA